MLNYLFLSHNFNCYYSYEPILHKTYIFHSINGFFFQAGPNKSILKKYSTFSILIFVKYNIFISTLEKKIDKPTFNFTNEPEPKTIVWQWHSCYVHCRCNWSYKWKWNTITGIKLNRKRSEEWRWRYLHIGSACIRLLCQTPVL